MSTGPTEPLPTRRSEQDSPRISGSSKFPPGSTRPLSPHDGFQNIDVSSSFSTNPAIKLSTNTIAPSPDLSDTLAADTLATSVPRFGTSPLSTDNSALRIQTDVHATAPSRSNSIGRNLTPEHKTSSSNLKPVSRTPSVKRAIASASAGTSPSTGSCVSSPVISALGDVTPLPSPLLIGDSPGPWKRFGARPPSRDQMPNPGPDSVLVSAQGESIAAALANAAKRKHYANEGSEPPNSGKGQPQSLPHGRNRSISDYVPDPLAIPKRQITVSGSHVQPTETPEAHEPHLRREANLAESRGLTPTAAQPPTPPRSESSKDSTDSAAPASQAKSSDGAEYFEAYGRFDGKKRRWRAIKLLGQGTFSRVLLATSQTNGGSSDDDDSHTSSQNQNGILTPTSVQSQPTHKRRTLVAVKVCEHGPRGGASEERIEMSLKRELEIMQSIHHPSLVHLKAWSIEPTRAILVISHCIGGDLFDVATAHRDVLRPPLLRRMFAELVAAVEFLHERRICHRDIKLENVLVNLTADELADPAVDWTTYPHPVITLTDLGLSRRIADDEKLKTRCGSEDYAAPEVIMGLPYDGRATDAWSLGVLLYALLESRLPFDPYPEAGGGMGINAGGPDGHRMRSRTSHRIARAEWRWIEYAGNDGKHDGSEAKFQEQKLLGAMEITEGLLTRARTRWGLDRVAENDWVRGAIRIKGGIKFREEEEGEEVV